MNAVEKMLAVLTLFDEAHPAWSVEEMMIETGFSRPTLYRYLKALREAGIVSSQGAIHRLGPRVTELDWLMRRSDPVLDGGQKALGRVAALHPGTAFLVRWYGQRILCIASEVSAQAPRSSYPRGRPMPLARGAASRAILAWLPKRVLDGVGGDGLVNLRAAGETEADIRARLRKVRRDGVAEARGEVTPGVIGLAAPIFDGTQPLAALCFTAEETETGPEILPNLKRALKEEADAITAALEHTDAGVTDLRMASPAPHKPERI
ncbi:MAG: IclR family transcriptional regulator C-terminal domain-containing protein [Sulfitobacter sp.]